MKKYGKTIGIVITLVLVIGAASFAYGKLKNQIQSPSLVSGEGPEDSREEDDREEDKRAENSGEGDQISSRTPEAELQNEESQNAESQDTDSSRQAAIDVSFYDSEGNSVKLSDFYGKPVVINFWATWCGYCKQEMPDFQEAFEEYGDQVEFLFINSTDGTRETREKAAAYLEEQGYTVPAYYDEDMEAVYVYSINSLPTTILLDREGRVAAYAPGLVEKEVLTNALDVLLDEEVLGG